MKRECKQVGVRESEAGVGVLRRPEGHESTFAPVALGPTRHPSPGQRHD